MILPKRVNFQDKEKVSLEYFIKLRAPCAGGSVSHGVKSTAFQIK